MGKLNFNHGIPVYSPTSEGDAGNNAKMRRLIEKSGLSVEEFADLLGRPVNAVLNWTLSSRNPTNYEMSYATQKVNAYLQQQRHKDDYER